MNLDFDEDMAYNIVLGGAQIPELGGREEYLTMSLTEKRTVSKTVYADARGRITLGSKAGKKDYRITETPQGEIVLTPVVQIPERELWLWQNPAALAALREGMAQAAAGEVNFLGSFAQFANLEIED